MRFFVSGNPRKNKTLAILLSALWIFLLMFWAINWLYYHFTFGLSMENMKIYFFGTPDFPERIAYENLLTDIHVFFFTNFFLFFLSASLLNLVEFRLKNTLITAGFLSLVGETGISLIVPMKEGLLPLKPFLFSLFQVITLLLLIIFVVKFFSLKSYTANKKGLNQLALIFAVFTLLFSILNFFLFLKKLGFSPYSVKIYFLGNEETFMRPKSFSGILKILYPHFLFIPILSFTLAHFLPFTQKKVNLSFILLLIFVPWLEMISSLGIRYISGDLAVVKILLLLFSIYLYTVASLKILSSMKMERENFIDTRNGQQKDMETHNKPAS